MSFTTKYHDYPIVLNDDNAIKIQICKRFPKTGDKITTTESLSMVCIKCIAENKMPDLYFFPVITPDHNNKGSSFVLGECSVHGKTRFAEL